MTYISAAPRRRYDAFRLIAGALFIFTLSGCAAGGMGKDEAVDPTAPLEKRQQSVDRLIKDALGDKEDKRERAAETLPRYGSLAVPPLVEMSGAGDLNDRLLAIKVLGKIGVESPEVLPSLLKSLTDQDEFVRLAAAEAIGMIPVVGEGSIPALREALSDSSPFVRSQAATSLVLLYRLRLEESDPFGRAEIVRSLAETGEAGIPLLLEILRGADPYIKPAVVEVLGETGEGNMEVLEALVGALAEGYPPLTGRVLLALEKFGPSAAPVLPSVTSLLQSGSSDWLICASLASIGSMGPVAQSAAQDIMPFLESRKARIRWCAAGTLLDIGLRPEAAAPVLIEKFVREGNTYNEEYLVLLGEKAVPFLQPLLTHEAADVRYRAISAIARSGVAPDNVFPLLMEGLTDENLNVRNETVRMLAESGSKAPEQAIPYLRPALENHNPYARVGSAAVLAAIAPDNSAAKQVLLEGMSSPVEDLYHPLAFGLIGLGEEGVMMAADALTDYYAQHNAIYILRLMGKNAVSAVPALMHIAVEEDYMTRKMAIDTLGVIGPGARAAVPLLLETLNDSNWVVRLSAKGALSLIDPSALEN